MGNSMPSWSQISVRMAGLLGPVGLAVGDRVFEWSESGRG